MRRCIDLASNAEGLTYPNPMVGSVVVNGGKIIGEGYHLKAGGAHAEVIAINSVSDKSLLKHSTLYVNLEPCSHYGKTPPCADFIVTHSIPRVVIGTLDTSDKVSGKGLAILKNAGCEVITGVEEMACRRLNRRFFTYTEKRRPYITLKWAESADGYLDIVRPEGSETGPNWITGKPERVLVHRWRASEQSILAGAGAIRADNPRLNVREWKGPDPVRIVLSGSGSIPDRAASGDEKNKWIVFTYNPDALISNAVKVELADEPAPAFQISEYLYNTGIQSLLIEGGTKVLDHFISNGLWDEARIFKGKRYFKEGIKAPVLKGKLLSKTDFSESCLEIYQNVIEGSF